jgi:hypothetical protein|tara:strand:- start:12539 stop:13414 length:876 start_codon:yes stop_codon:yes gene_type:complete
MKTVNIVCTSKPGDGLFHYSYEYCCFLNDLGINAKLIIIPNKKHIEQDYIDAINECYIKFENIVFNVYMPRSDDITLIMGRSMLTLAYLDYNSYTEEQKLTLHSLFGGKLISVYSENHPKEYPLAVEHFNFAPDKVVNLCDHEVYVNGIGDQFEKIINFSIYKPVVDNIQFKYLFLGTNRTYYREVEKHIKDYSSHGILAYKDKFINEKRNHVFVPVKNLLGLFDTYVYTKPNFDPAPRIIQECKWLGKEVIYLRDKSIIDGGPVYWKRPAKCLTEQKDKIENLLKWIEKL